MTLSIPVLRPFPAYHTHKHSSNPTAQSLDRNLGSKPRSQGAGGQYLGDGKVCGILHVPRLIIKNTKGPFYLLLGRGLHILLNIWFLRGWTALPLTGHGRGEQLRKGERAEHLEGEKGVRSIKKFPREAKQEDLRSWILSSTLESNLLRNQASPCPRRARWN